MQVSGWWLRRAWMLRRQREACGLQVCVHCPACTASVRAAYHCAGRAARVEGACADRARGP